MKYKLIITLIIIILFCSNIALSMNVEETDEEYSIDGCVLYTPWLGTKTYLIDNEGAIKNQWNSKFFRGFPVYLLEDGSLIRADFGGFRIPPKFFFTGGCTGRVEMFDWEGKLIWTFVYVNFKHCLHNDIEPLPNGNILMLVWESKTRTEALNAGIKPENVGNGPVMFDKIIEVEPTGRRGGNIVWEWSLWDHLIQDHDSTKDNFGIVKNHPELIDINSKGKKVMIEQNLFFTREKTDFSHFNSLDYNEELDQIMVSSRYLNEIYVIDHSTTTEEAKGHSGGKYGQGGDILYRWGNPINYDAGEKTDRKLYAQHDAQWIKSGLAGQGNILIFDNGWGRDEEYSSVIELVPPTDQSGSYILEEESAYGPDEPIWNYTAENPTDFYSSMMSGAQRLPDGNTLICSGVECEFFVVTPEKEVVWQYKNNYPIRNSFLNYVYKTQYYPNDFPGILS